MKTIATLATLTLTALLVPSSLPAEELLPASQRRALARSAKVESALVAELERNERVRVIAILDVRADDGASLERFDSYAARQALREEGDRVLTQLPADHFDLSYRYGAVNSIAGEADAEGVLALMAQPGISRVGLDERQSWTLGEALDVSNIRSVRGQAKHGKGVWVAVLDSGVDTNHRDLKKPLKKEECFCKPNCCPNGTSRQSGKGSAEDDVGHGTLVAGSIVSRGKVGPGGPARNAKLLAIKVGGQQGPLTSDTIAALDWILQEMSDVRVINMSFGSLRSWAGNCDRKGVDNRVRSSVINGLRDLGILSFAASGNSARTGGMVSPACIKKVVSVGAVYDDNFGSVDWGDCLDPTTEANQLICFTDRSKTLDLVAPGALITGPQLGGGVDSNVGTSFSSPLAAGCAVLIRKKYPDATADEIEEAMTHSPTLAADPENNREYPVLDCQDAFDHLGG